MRRCLFVLCSASAVAALKLATTHALTRRSVSTASIALLPLLHLQSAAAADTTCTRDCLKECSGFAPGDPQYCRAECDSYCAADGAKGRNDVVRAEVSEAAQPAKGSPKNAQDEYTARLRVLSGGTLGP